MAINYGTPILNGLKQLNYGRVLNVGSAATVDTLYLSSSATANAQRSVTSASANDSAAGTGVRTIRVTYYDANMAGPFTEDITMNGTTAVNTVNTNICYLERIKALTTGSGAFAAGNINFWTTTGGGGTNYATLPIGEVDTFWSHHYVPADKTCYVGGVLLSATKAGRMNLHVRFPVGNPLIGEYTLFEVRILAGNSFYYPIDPPIPIVGPAYLFIRGVPDATATNFHAALDYIDA